MAAGCAPTRLSVTTQPQGAFVKVDGQNVGNAPLSKEFDFYAKNLFVISASHPGYFQEEFHLTERTPGVDVGRVHLVLMEDEAWKATTTSEATNAWLRVQVDPRVTHEQMWQKLVDSVTTTYSSLEQMDNSSGYLRSVTTMRRFRGPKGTFIVRTRFLGSVAQKEPLVYKLKIESDVSPDGADWEPYSRIYKQDAALIEELQSRMGIK